MLAGPQPAGEAVLRLESLQTNGLPHETQQPEQADVPDGPVSPAAPRARQAYEPGGSQPHAGLPEQPVVLAVVQPVGEAGLRQEAPTGLQLTCVLSQREASLRSDDDDDELSRAPTPTQNTLETAPASVSTKQIEEGFLLCWGGTQNLLESMLDLMSSSSHLGVSGLPSEKMMSFWSKMQHCCSEATSMFNQISRDGQLQGAQGTPVSELVSRISREHGRFHIQLLIANHLARARCVPAGVLDRTDMQLSLGIANASKARRVLVTVAWLECVLGNIKNDHRRSNHCNTNQKLILEASEIANEHVVALRTRLAGSPYEERQARKGEEDTSPIDFQPFLQSLPEQLRGSQWAVCFLDVNWDYTRTAERFKLQEGIVSDRIPYLLDLLGQVSGAHFAALKAHPELYITPSNYWQTKPHCPIALWLKRLDGIKGPPEKTQGEALPQPHADASWSWTPHYWNWNQ